MSKPLQMWINQLDPWMDLGVPVLKLRSWIPALEFPLRSGVLFDLPLPTYREQDIGFTSGAGVALRLLEWPREAGSKIKSLYWSTDRRDKMTSFTAEINIHSLVQKKQNKKKTALVSMVSSPWDENFDVPHQIKLHKATDVCITRCVFFWVTTALQAVVKTAGCLHF